MLGAAFAISSCAAVTGPEGESVAGQGGEEGQLGGEQPGSDQAAEDPAALPNCDKRDIQIFADTDKVRYSPNETPSLGVTVSYLGREPCEFQVAEGAYVARILDSGNQAEADVVSSSEFCGDPYPSQVFTLQPGGNRSAPGEWSRKLSSQGVCGDSRSEAPLGAEYYFQVEIEGVESNLARFELLEAAAESDSSENRGEEDPTPDSGSDNEFLASDASSDGVALNVSSVDYGVQSPNRFAVGEPLGQLASVSVEVENESSESITLSSRLFSGFIGTSTFTAEGLVEADGSPLVYQTVNPGLSITFNIYFDIPEGERLFGIEYKTRPVSGEVIDINLPAS